MKYIIFEITSTEPISNINDLLQKIKNYTCHNIVSFLNVTYNLLNNHHLERDEVVRKTRIDNEFKEFIFLTIECEDHCDVKLLFDNVKIQDDTTIIIEELHLIKYLQDEYDINNSDCSTLTYVLSKKKCNISENYLKRSRENKLNNISKKLVRDAYIDFLYEDEFT